MPPILISSPSRSISPDNLIQRKNPRPQDIQNVPLKLAAGKKRLRDDAVILSPPHSTAPQTSHFSTATPEFQHDRPSTVPNGPGEPCDLPDVALLERLSRLEDMVSTIPSLRDTIERLSASPNTAAGPPSTTAASPVIEDTDRVPATSSHDVFRHAANKATPMSIYEFSAAYIHGNAHIFGHRCAPVMKSIPCIRCEALGLSCQTVMMDDVYLECIPGYDHFCCGWCTRDLEFQSHAESVADKPYQLQQDPDMWDAQFTSRLKVPPTRIQWCIADDGIDEEVLEEDIAVYMGVNSRAYRKDYDELPIGHGYFIVADAGHDLHESTIRTIMKTSSDWQEEKRAMKLAESRSLGRRSEYRWRRGRAQTEIPKKHSFEDVRESVEKDEDDEMV